MPSALRRQWTVDAFASRPFTGNPAAVVEPFDTWPDDAWMQALAEENNHAETAYLRRTSDPARFDLRWFTPSLEVPLCGHATLAGAHVLFSELGNPAPVLRFQTGRSGELTVERVGDAYRMNLPASLVRPVEAPVGLAAALGVEPLQVLAGSYLMVILPDAEAVRTATPDIAALKTMGASDTEPGNVIITAQADVGATYQVVSRFFAPGSGVAEDPATGSAHCMLAPYWAARLGRLRLDFHQAYPGRGADMMCEVAGQRILITGGAVTVLEARLRLQS